MIDLGPNCLLMIEPEGGIEAPVDDEYTVMAMEVFATAKKTLYYRGMHHCVCGQRSDNVRWVFEIEGIGEVETNSLMIHYVRDHRSEVPETELQKLRMIHENRRR